MNYLSIVTNTLFPNPLKGEPNVVKDLRAHILNNGGYKAWIKAGRFHMVYFITYDFGRIINSVEHNGYCIITTDDKCMYLTPHLTSYNE